MRLNEVDEILKALNISLAALEEENNQLHEDVQRQAKLIASLEEEVVSLRKRHHRLADYLFSDFWNKFKKKAEE